MSMQVGVIKIHYPVSTEHSHILISDDLNYKQRVRGEERDVKIFGVIISNEMNKDRRYQEVNTARSYEKTFFLILSCASALLLLSPSPSPHDPPLFLMNQCWILDRSSLSPIPSTLCRDKKILLVQSSY